MEKEEEYECIMSLPSKSLHFCGTRERESKDFTQFDLFKSLFFWNYENSPTQKNSRVCIIINFIFLFQKFKCLILGFKG